MSYLFPALLTIGLPLIALPLAIHLINLRRRQRVAWAAMDFLLESQKRNKRSILLKQILLLALRTLAVACVVLMLAGPVVRSSWASLFGAGITHHLILIDDSYSMGDRQGERTVWSEAARVTRSIVDAARGRSERQVVTLLPFSEARAMAAGDMPPIHRAPLDAALIDALDERLGARQPSQSSAGPLDALEAAGRLPEASEDETRIVYLLSDFRRPQWAEAGALRQQAAEVRAKASQLRLIQCVEQMRVNLGISRFEPAAGLRAAGVETWMEVGVRNFGDAPVASLTLELRHNDLRLPALQFDEIPPGDEATQQFRVTLSAAGSRLEAELPDDALPADNRRYFAASPPAAYPVLLIDESPRGDDGRYLAAALNPGQSNLSGWLPEVERRSILRQAESLQRFAAICLLDVPRLDEQEAENLEKYVAAGGGVAFFVGPQAQRDYYNEALYRAGAGLFPLPLEMPRQLLSGRDEAGPDLEVADDPLFKVFAGRRNSFLELVRVDFYYGTDLQWRAPADGTVKTLARLRNQAPWVVEKRIGEGLTIVQLGKLSPQPTDLGRWSNFSINPAFPIYANELIGKLSANRRSYALLQVEEALVQEAPSDSYTATTKIQPPASAPLPSFEFEGARRGLNWQIALEPPLAPGVWETEWRPRSDAPSEVASRVQLTAVNVQPEEGELHFLQQADLNRALEGVDFEFSRAAEFSQTGEELAGYNLTTTLVGVLAAMLVLEQLAAYAASYHARSRGSFA